MVMHIAVALLLAHSHHHSGGSGGHSTSGGHSNTGESGASGVSSLSTHQTPHFTKHVVGATLISHYLICFSANYKSFFLTIIFKDFTVIKTIFF